MKAVAPPSSAIIHIQKTAPGPPMLIARATPATLPVPTREAAEMVKALNAEMLPAPAVGSATARNMSGT